MRNGLIAIIITLLLIGLTACQPETQPSVEGNAVLMTVGSQEVREDDFRRAYRVFRASYGAGVDEPPAIERSSMLRFLQQLTDQLILMEYARENGVTISDEALDQAVDEIRSDYPEGLFDQMLLENAVNFEDWREALRVRLTIERLVQKELADKVTITEDDLAAHYRSRASDQPSPVPETEGNGADQIDQLLVEQLRRQKTEAAYGPWLEGLRARYAVSIDQAVLQDIMADSGLPTKGGEDGRP
jgi:hypothetical protein